MTIMSFYRDSQVSRLRRAAVVLIGTVWIVNGLYAKVLGQVERHEEIVGQILGEHPMLLTKTIGVLEIILGIAILIRFQPKRLGWFQIVIVLTMNIIENLRTPDLLLWGNFNLLFAILFCLLVWWTELKPQDYGR